MGQARGTTRKVASGFLLLGAVGAGLIWSPAAEASSIGVTTCSGSPAIAGSLPNVVASAPSGATITFAISCPATAPIVLATALTVDQPLTITGTGASSVVISGGGTTGLFDVTAGGALSLSGLTLTDGASMSGVDNGDQNAGPSGNGGAVDVADGSTASLVADNVTFSDDAALIDGGAIDCGDEGGSGSVTVTNSTFSGDTAGNDGGAIDMADFAGTCVATISTSTFSQNAANGSPIWDPGGGALAVGNDAGTATLNVDHSTFTDNSSQWTGGAIDLGDQGTGTASIATSTFVGNTAGTDGGAIDVGDSPPSPTSSSHGTLSVTSSTFSQNSSELGGAIDTGNSPGGSGATTLMASTLFANTSLYGGQLDSGRQGGSGSVDLLSSVVAGDPSGPECDGSVTDLGASVDDDGSCTMTAPDSVSHSATVDSAFDALAANGGPTETLLPTSSGPLIGAIPTGTTLAGHVLCPTTDQRGVTSTGACTIGAVQVNQAAPEAPDAPQVTPGNGTASVTGAAPYDNGSRITGYLVTATDLTDPSRGGQSASGTSFPLVVGNLSNGDSYTFTVAASNAFGTGAASPSSAAVVPLAPGPNIVRALLPTATIGRPYAPVALHVLGVATSTAAGKTTTVMWKKVSLPKGLKLSTTGALSGSLSHQVTPGTSPVVVHVTETAYLANGTKVQRVTTSETATLSLTVVAPSTP